jgi:hypothetical protein
LFDQVERAVTVVVASFAGRPAGVHARVRHVFLV